MTTTAPQQRKPDGRPLYAYKWDDRYYELLKTAVREQMPSVLRGREDTVLRPCFASMRRKPFAVGMKEGRGQWETVFAEIGHAIPDYQSIYAWVEKGLQHFKRPLLRSRNGRSGVSGYPRL